MISYEQWCSLNKQMSFASSGIVNTEALTKYLNMLEVVKQLHPEIKMPEISEVDDTPLNEYCRQVLRGDKFGLHLYDTPEKFYEHKHKTLAFQPN